MSRQEATIQVLTAEVRVLQIAGKSATLTMFRQLDRVEVEEMVEVFGRVNEVVKDYETPDLSFGPFGPNRIEGGYTWIIGKDQDGDLCRCIAPRKIYNRYDLIILAGLK